ncbi:GAF domain-containing protein [Mycolicibacterium phlei]
MAEVYRAPMRSRRDGLDPQAALERALGRGLVGFGEAGVDGPAALERLARRVERFAAVPDGSFVWTRDTDGRYRLGRVDGPYRYDDDPAAVDVDLVHVRPCVWVADAVSEADVPAAVVATFGRGGRSFQRTHDPDVGAQTARLWAALAESA